MKANSVQIAFDYIHCVHIFVLLLLLHSVDLSNPFPLPSAAILQSLSEGENIVGLEAVQHSYSGGNGRNVRQSIEHCDFGLSTSGHRTLIAHKVLECFCILH